MSNTFQADDAVTQNAHEAYLTALLDGAVKFTSRMQAAAQYPEGSILRMLLGEKDLEAARRNVLTLARETNYENLIPQGSKMRSIFDEIECRHRSYLETVISRAKDHHDVISEKFLRGHQPSAILSLKAPGSDSHNGNCHTVIIETDVGSFLYKPRSLKAEAAVSQICNELFPNQFLVPAVIDCGSFGFSQFVQCEDPQDEGDLDSYFTALGTFCALAYFLSISDLHAENFLAAKDRLVPLDLETILASSGRPATANPPANSFAADTQRSIFNTGMLTYGNGQLIGSILTGTRHSLLPIDDCHVALDHKAQIIEGFKTGFCICLANKDLLVSAIRQLEDEPVRILLENTRFYSAIQQRVFNCRPGKEDEITSSAKALLSSKKRACFPREVLESEFESILKGDIPYFSIMANGRSLQDCGGTLIENYLQESPLQQAIKHIESIDEADCAFQTRLLEKTLDDMPFMGESTPVPLSEADICLSTERASYEAGAMLAQLYADIIPGVASKGGIWAAKYGDTHKAPMNASLATGYAGAGVFAAACLTADAGDAAHAEVVINLCLEELHCHITQLESIPNLASRIDVGLSDGLAGIARALQLIWRYSQHAAIPEIYRSLLSIIDALDTSRVPGCNIYNGLGGLLLVLCCEAPVDPALETIERIADELLSRGIINNDGHRIWKERDGSTGEIGYGKGNGGIGLAFLRAWQATGNDRYWDACRDALAYESEGYSEELGFWPLKHVARGKRICAPGICRGIAGQAVVFAQAARQNVPLAQANVELARRCLQAIKPEPTDNLCCGTGAIVEGLLAVGMSDRAGRLLEAQLERKNQLGSYIHENSKRIPYFNPSLFFGCLGIGYELLRYADPDKIESLFS